MCAYVYVYMCVHTMNMMVGGHVHHVYVHDAGYRTKRWEERIERS